MSHPSVPMGFLVIFLIFASSSAGAAEAIGSVSKVQGSANPAVGVAVHMNDRLRTGANGRMVVTFRDGSVLTLGENANVVVDRFVYDPAKSKGELAVSATRGAFRFAGGKLEQMQSKKVTVSTPHAALAVRGTDFWAGPIDGQYGVLLLKGKVSVSNRAGAVTLSRPGYGTDISLRRKR